MNATPPEPAGFLSAADAARELTVLARAFAAAFEAFAARSAVAPVGARSSLATASRVLGEHAQVFATLVPESVLLAPERAAGAAATLKSPAAPADHLCDVDRAVAQLAARANPVADGALLRAAAHARADLAALGASLRALEQAGGGSDLV